MTTVITSQETFDLSGFGGGYEDACQRMLWRGVAYLAEHQPPVSMWDDATEYEGIVGVMSIDGEDLKSLETHIMRDIDATGAMHQCVMGHLRFIHRKGIDEWRRELSEHRPEGATTWEGEL